MAAFCFGASQVTARRGLVDTSIIAGMLISLSTAFLVIGGLVALNPPEALDATGLLFFSLGGLAAPGVSRWAATTGVHRLGPSIAVPITQGVRPILAVTGAVLLLGESVDLQRFLGLTAIVAGGWYLSRSREEARTMSLGAFEGGHSYPLRRFRPGIVFPLLAGLAYASSDLLVKHALGYLPYATLGAFVGIATALTTWGGIISFVPRARRQLRVGRDFGWLIVSGGLNALALMSIFSALERGDVSLVSTLAASQPLTVFVFSRLLLRSIERLDASTVIAGSAVVAGTILVSL